MMAVEKGDELKVAWLRLIAGKPEEAEKLVLNLSTPKFWQQFLTKYQIWVDDGCYNATLKYWGFSDENCAAIQKRIEEKGVWNPREEAQEEVQAPMPQLPEQVQPQLQMAGLDLMTALIHSRMAIVMVGPPGSGKTTTAKGWILGKLKHYPKAVVRAIGLKNYEFYGLSAIPGFSTVLRQEGGAIDFTPLIEALRWLDGILEFRRHSAEGTDFSEQSSWLLITDYTPIANELQKLQPDLAKQVFSVIYRLITVGREYHVGIFLDLHSLNLAILGFADSFSRNAMVLVGLGFETQGEEGLRGNYTAIQSILKNAWITSNAMAFNAVLGKAIAESKRRGVPLFWTSVNNEKLGFMPDLSALDSNKPGGLRQLPESFLKTYSAVLQASLDEDEVEEVEPIASPPTSKPPIARGLELLGNSADAETAEAITWGLLEWADRTESALSRAVRHLLRTEGKKFVKEEVLGCKGTAYSAIGEPWLQRLLR